VLVPGDHPRRGHRPAPASDLAELGQRLGVTFHRRWHPPQVCHSYRGGISVRIDAVATGHCLWTERYDFPDAELFAVQDAVCEAVVAAAYPMLVAYTQAGLRRVRRPHELQTWELAHEGMRLCTLREAAANHDAQSLFRLAIEREPELLLAHFGLGIASFDDLLNQWSAPTDAHRQLLTSAERCVTLAPHGAEGHYLLGRYFQSSGEPALAARSLESAIQRNPSFAPAHALLAQMLEFSDRSDEALTRMKHAAQLGPGRYSAALATVHFSRGEYGEALVAIEDVLVSTPLYPFARALAAASAFWAGDRARASEHASRLQRLVPGFSVPGFMISFGARLGPVERFAAALKGIDAAR
jgi:tetratricopeptide (TPR) repeat protein